MPLTLNLPKDLEEQLVKEAKRQGMPADDFALQVLRQHLNLTDDVFKKAATQVLQENAELYRRLAR